MHDDQCQHICQSIDDIGVQASHIQGKLEDVREILCAALTGDADESPIAEIANLLRRIADSVERLADAIDNDNDPMMRIADAIESLAEKLGKQ